MRAFYIAGVPGSGGFRTWSSGRTPSSEAIACSARPASSSLAGRDERLAVLRRTLPDEPQRVRAQPCAVDRRFELALLQAQRFGLLGPDVVVDFGKPRKAFELFVEACIHRPARVAPDLRRASFGQLLGMGHHARDERSENVLAPGDPDAAAVGEIDFGRILAGA